MQKLTSRAKKQIRGARERLYKKEQEALKLQWEELRPIYESIGLSVPPFNIDQRTQEGRKIRNAENAIRAKYYPILNALREAYKAERQTLLENMALSA